MTNIPQLQMVWPRQRLAAPPEPQLAPGYTLRLYQAGDEPQFYQVMALAGWPGWDDERLKPWLARIPPDSWFMVLCQAEQRIVATAMGLHDHTDWHPFGGELGWVACDPRHTGHGLGLAVSAAVTRKLIAAGYYNIHLYTEHFRLSALKTYLKLGYIPYLSTSDISAVWADVCAQLRWPYQPERWRELATTHSVAH